MLLSFDSKEDLLVSLSEKEVDEEFLIIANYKSLKKWSLIPLKNITVLMGPNSAGKSTVEDCLLLLNLLLYPHYQEEYAHNILMKMFEGYRSKYDFKDRPFFGFSTFYDTKYRFINKFYDDRFKNLEKNYFEDADYKIFNKLPFISNLIENKKYQAELKKQRYTLILNEVDPEVLDAEIYIGKILCASWLYAGSYINFDINKNFINLANRKLTKKEKSILEIFDDLIEVRYPVESKSRYSVWPSFNESPDFFWKNEKINFDFLEDEDLLPSEEYSELNYDIWRLQYGLCLACFYIPINTFIGKIQNIDRTEDLRILTSSWNFFKPNESKYFTPSLTEKKATDNIKINNFVYGIKRIINDYISHILSNKKEDLIFLNLLNKWLYSDVFLDTKYRLLIDLKICVPEKFLFPKYDIKKALDSRSENPFNPNGTSEVEFLIRLKLLDQNDRHLDFKNVGSGIGQIIPILASIMVGSSFIKQPEVHLHPKLQSRLADCIIDALNISLLEKNNKYFFVETHSEHLILRLLRRVRNSFLDSDLHTSLTLAAKSVSFVYFKPLKDETEIYQIRIDESGNFLDRWPDGFFDDRDEDIWN